MSTITLSKNKYQELKQKASGYERIVRVLADEVFAPPPVRNRKKIVAEFQRTGLHNLRFIASLKRGLTRSDYFKLA